MGDEVFEDMDLREIQKLIDTTPAKLTENDLMEMSPLEPVKDSEEKKHRRSHPENKLTLDNLADVFRLLKVL